MNEFSEVSHLLEALGVKSIFAPLLSIIILLFLVKKYLFNGFSTFAKESIKDWLDYQREKIKADVSILETLKDIDEQLKEVQNKAETCEDLTRQHIAETHSLILILKKKTDKVDEEFNKVDTQYFKAPPS